jgi:prepilin-type N-terminal cleavage/methylation domain-containing protein
MNNSKLENTSSASRQIAGFTLLELLAATSIIAITLATATNSIATYHRGQKLFSAASSLRLLVERTYCHALATRQEMLVVIEPTMARALNNADKEKERLLFKAPLAPELRGNQPQEIRLYSSLSASPTTVTLRLGKNTCAVIVSLRGRVRTQCA